MVHMQGLEPLEILGTLGVLSHRFGMSLLERSHLPLMLVRRVPEHALQVVNPLGHVAYFA
jgi:hypothetical protein